MIVFEIGEDRGGRIEFDEVTKAIVWVQEEIERWSRLINGIGIQGADTPLTSILKSWTRIVDGLKEFRKSGPKNFPPSYHLGPDETENLVVFSSLIGQALVFVANRVGSAPADNVALSLGIGHGDINWNDQGSISGLVAFQFVLNEFRRADGSLSSSKMKSVDDIINRLTDDINLMHMRLAEISQKAEGVLSHYDSKISEFDNKFKNGLSGVELVLAEKAEDFDHKISEIIDRSRQVYNGLEQSEKDFKQSLDKSVLAGENKISDWVSAQMEQTRLEAPVTLWGQRAEDHKDKANSLRYWSFGIGAGGFLVTSLLVIIFYSLAGWLFEGAIIGNPDPSYMDVKGSGAFQIRPTFYYELILTSAFTLLWLTLFLWMMRVLVRRYATEEHLAIDASARAAMTQTYLGLIKDGGASDQERAIVLGSLFRPVSERATNEEGPPSVSLPALAAAIVSGKSGQ